MNFYKYLEISSFIQNKSRIQEGGSEVEIGLVKNNTGQVVPQLFGKKYKVTSGVTHNKTSPTAQDTSTTEWVPLSKNERPNLYSAAVDAYKSLKQQGQLDKVKNFDTKRPDLIIGDAIRVQSDKDNSSFILKERRKRRY